jgi:hypothetical protein
MDDTTLATLTPAQLRKYLLDGDDPYGELTHERYAQLAALGIRDPLGYLTDDEWYERALRCLDPELAEPIIFDIDTIDWTTLEHPFGTAKKVPIQIRALLTEDYLSACVAWHDLPSCLLHQGSIGSATVATLPYFLRMLRSDAPRLQYLSLSFLCALAWVTQPEDQEDDATCPISDTLSQALARIGRDADAEMQQQAAYRGTIWSTLIATLPEVEPFTKDEIAEIREVAQLLRARLMGTSDE